MLGYRPMLAWLEQLPHGLRDPVHIVDVGSGGGDLLRQIAGWAQRRGIAVQLTGIDLNPYAARAAAESTPKELGITWVTGDALVYRAEKPMDIVVSSVLAHHLEHEEIVALLRWMEATVQVGWFIRISKELVEFHKLGWPRMLQQGSSYSKDGADFFPTCPGRNGLSSPVPRLSSCGSEA